ncbi:hypothetical protein NPIL_688071 [Nephila pilipes]|uniref:Uncharacterized protein n=1 Tax=Nephila pilipes TaxID=299642 RepID=A0A8X6KLB7_NEPPI|nr:hypothetical protein NPIL_688071 [Nephila pilipes]
MASCPVFAFEQPIVTLNQVLVHHHFLRKLRFKENCRVFPLKTLGKTLLSPKQKSPSIQCFWDRGEKPYFLGSPACQM